MPKALLLVFCAATVLPALPVQAQPTSQAELERCAELDSDRDKLRCFQALTDRGRTIGLEIPVVESAPAPVIIREEVVDVDQSAPASPAEPARPPAVSGGGSRDVQPVITAIPDDLGQEQLPSSSADRAEEELRVIATVIRVTRGARDIRFFHFDNGQVWRQIESGYVAYPRNEPFPVEITQGLLGEYRLRVGGDGPLVRIRRVE